jgi:hypothetical protein
MTMAKTAAAALGRQEQGCSERRQIKLNGMVIAWDEKDRGARVAGGRRECCITKHTAYTIQR